MLDQHGDEPLDRAEDDAVDHDRSLRLAVRGDVGQVEALGSVKSHWMVAHCQERPIASSSLTSILGP